MGQSFFHLIIIKNRAIVHYKYFCQSLRKVAKIYKIGKSTLCRWLKQQEVPIKTKRKSIISTIQETIKSQLIKNPFLTTHELSKRAS
jgi:transposase